MSFITVQELSDYRGQTLTGDNGGTLAVNMATQLVQTACEQTLTYGTVTETYDGTGTDSLLLRQVPVNNAGTVSVNGTAITDYRVDTQRGMLTRGTAFPGTWTNYDYWPGITWWPEGRQNVTVTYEYGYSTIPDDIRMVTLAVANRLVAQGAAIQESVGDASVRYGTNSTDLTAGEQMILRKYMRLR